MPNLHQDIPTTVIATPTTGGKEERHLPMRKSIQIQSIRMYVGTQLTGLCGIYALYSFLTVEMEFLMKMKVVMGPTWAYTPVKVCTEHRMVAIAIPGS